MSYICVADVQDHKAELTVLILVQLMNQLSIVSLQKEAHNTVYLQKHTGDDTSSVYPEHCS